MTLPCEDYHLFWEALPDGTALYPISGDSRRDDVNGWLADALSRFDQATSGTVYLDLGRVGYPCSLSLSAILRIYKKAREGGGRLEVCNVREPVLSTFREWGLERDLELTLNDRDVPGRTLRLPDPAWLVWQRGTVAALARAAREDPAAGLMPVLADALEDAGCGIADILDHCREPVPHGRDCWVIGLLLGKG